MSAKFRIARTDQVPSWTIEAPLECPRTRLSQREKQKCGYPLPYHLVTSRDCTGSCKIPWRKQYVCVCFDAAVTANDLRWLRWIWVFRDVRYRSRKCLQNKDFPQRVFLSNLWFCGQSLVNNTLKLARHMWPWSHEAFRHTLETNDHLIVLMKSSPTYLELKKVWEGFSLAHLRTTLSFTLPEIGGLKVCSEGARNRIWPGLEFFLDMWCSVFRYPKRT